MRAELEQLKQLVAELALKNRALKRLAGSRRSAGSGTTATTSGTTNRWATSPRRTSTSAEPRRCNRDGRKSNAGHWRRGVSSTPNCCGWPHDRRGRRSVSQLGAPICPTLTDTIHGGPCCSTVKDERECHSFVSPNLESGHPGQSASRPFE